MSPCETKPRTIRVLVADDHPLYRDALGRAIAASQEFDVVAEAANASEAIDAIERLLPDVAVLDVKMPGNGRKVLDALKRRQLPTRVLFISEYADASSVRAGLSAGAGGYLSKDADAAAIRRSIREIAQGGTPVSAAAEGLTLTQREIEMLKLIAGGFSNNEIAARLYVSPETVKTHLHRLYSRLGVAGRSAAVAGALRRGLID